MDHLLRRSGIEEDFVPVVAEVAHDILKFFEFITENLQYCRNETDGAE